ncbi:hypothetical protein DI53_1452 [Sphingobacterium deserti]|uniref:Uncharacterized protein n=1 Tax=Sphingobacterium deserti TaxID=1229276 RepID=A0A0B8T4J3_9SPHI|nr:hypothetical protein DI53_1452 [Sphingobacterium deserti]
MIITESSKSDVVIPNVSGTKAKKTFFEPNTMLAYE